MYLLVGGEDHVVGVDNKELQVGKFNALEKWMRERWPAAGPVVYQWSGQIQVATAATPASPRLPLPHLLRHVSLAHRLSWSCVLLVGAH